MFLKGLKKARDDALKNSGITYRRPISSLAASKRPAANITLSDDENAHEKKAEEDDKGEAEDDEGEAEDDEDDKPLKQSTTQRKSKKTKKGDVAPAAPAAPVAPVDTADPVAPADSADIEVEPASWMPVPPAFTFCDALEVFESF